MWGCSSPRRDSCAWRAQPVRAALQVAALASLGTLGCQRSFDDPLPPDTSLLEAAYDEPGGRLSAGELPEVLQRVREQLAAVQQTERFELLQELLLSTAHRDGTMIRDERVDDRESSRLLVVVQATRACSNAASASGAEASAIHMTVRGSPRGIFPIVWGSFEHCLAPLGPMQVELDGDFWMSLRDQPRGRSFLFSFSGSIGAGQVRRELELDFRLLPTGTIELRIATLQGDIIFALDAEGYTARDSEGSWSCDLLLLHCENMASGESLQAEEAP